MFESYDEGSSHENPLLLDEPWVRRLNETVSKGKVSMEEPRIIRLFTDSLSMKAKKLSATHPDQKISNEERSILEK